MAQPKHYYIRLGIFVIAGSLLLLAGAYFIGSEQKVFTRTFELSAVFKNVAGLQAGNNVRYSGINVGTVRLIEMEDDTTIRVSMRIDAAMQPHIRKNAIAIIGSDGLVGSMLVNIIPGETGSARVAPGDEIPSYSRISTQDMLTTLNVTNENAALLTADLLEITAALKNRSGTLGRLLHDSTMARDLQASAANLRTSSARAEAFIARLDAMLEGMNYEESTAALFLDDPDFTSQMTRIAHNLDSTAGQMKNFTHSLNALLKDARKGSGSLSLLLQDSLSAEHLKSSLMHLDSGLIKFDQNMEALKHNFLTRRYFRKLERQNRKLERQKEKARDQEP